MKRHATPRVIQTGLVILLALPWLSPLAPGPSPAVVPLLVSLGCVALLCAVVSLNRVCLSPQVIAVSLCGAALISSVLGLFQYLGWSPHLAPWVNQTVAGEAFANLRQRNQFATLTNMALTALLRLALMDRAAAQREWVIWAAAGLLAAGAAASSSRTGLLQLVLLCMLFGVWGCWRQHLARRLLLVALFSYALATLFLPWLAGLDPTVHGSFSRLRNGDAVCTSRLTLWSNVLQLIAQKPWFGWGWGELDYAHYMTLYPAARFCDILDNAHNLPLHLAVELGIPFAVLVCGASFWVVLRARPWRETDPMRQLAWGVLALILLHSLLEYPLWYGPFQIAFALCVHLLWATRAQHGGSARLVVGAGPARTRTGYFLAATAAVMMAATAYAAWEYHRVSQIYLAPALRDPAYRDNTLEKIRGTRLFRQQVDFAVLSLTPLTPANALDIYVQSNELLHFSPEPRVIEKVIESAVMLGRDDEALLHLVRYRAAFPKSHAQWRQAIDPTEEHAD